MLDRIVQKPIKITLKNTILGVQNMLEFKSIHL